MGFAKKIAHIVKTAHAKRAVAKNKTLLTQRIMKKIVGVTDKKYSTPAKRAITPPKNKTLLTQRILKKIAKRRTVLTAVRHATGKEEESFLTKKRRRKEGESFLTKKKRRRKSFLTKQKSR